MPRSMRIPRPVLLIAIITVRIDAVNGATARPLEINLTTTARHLFALRPIATSPQPPPLQPVPHISG